MYSYLRMVMKKQQQPHAAVSRNAPNGHDLRQACRAAGLKVTHQREVIFEEIVNTTDHPSAETLYERVRAKIPAVSRDTVYRTLAMLEEAGFVSRLTLRGATRFDGDASAHHHFYCTQCGSVHDFDWCEFDRLGLPETATACGEIASSRVVLEGICRNCIHSEDNGTGSA